MKALLILLMVSASYAYPVARTWTLYELDHAMAGWNYTESLKDPVKKSMIDAYNEMMASMFSGKETYYYVQAIMLSPNGSKLWTMEQLVQTLKENTTSPDIMRWIDYSLSDLVQQNRNEKKMDAIEVRVPTMDISTWTENEVTKALADPEVKSDLKSFLTPAKKQFDDAKEKGEKLETVELVTPVGVVPPPEGRPIIFVPRPVHKDMIVNKEGFYELDRERQKNRQ